MTTGSGSKSSVYEVPCCFVEAWIFSLSMNDWYVVYHIEYINHKELLTNGQTTLSILIGSVRWRLTNLWRDSFPAVWHISQDEKTLQRTRSMHFWGSLKYLGVVRLIIIVVEYMNMFILYIHEDQFKGFIVCMKTCG